MKLRESKERFDRAARQSREMVWEIAPDGIFTYVSPASEDIFGYSPHEMIGTLHFWDLQPEGAREALKVSGLNTIAQQKSFANQVDHAQSKSGRQVTVLSNGSPVFDDAGRLRGYVGSDFDITDRETTAAALRESEERYRTIVQTAAEGIWQLDADCRSVFVNRRMADVLGRTESEMLGHPVDDFLFPEDRADHAVHWKERQTGVVGRYVRRFARGDGTAVWCQISSTPIMTSDGEFLGSFAMLTDITARKAAELALEQSEAKYRALVETTGTGFVILDDDGKVLDANPEYVRLTGRQALRDIQGRSVLEWTSADDRSRNIEELSRCQVAGYTRNLEITYVAPDGSSTPVEINATIVDSDGPRRILSLCHDISDRRKAARALQESEERYRSLYNTMLTGFVLCEIVFNECNTPVDFRVLDINPAAERLLGTPRDQLVGQLALKMYPAFAGKWLEVCAQVGLSGKTHPLQYYSERVDRHFEGTIFSYQKGLFAAAFMDVSERVRSELALHESERLHRTLVGLSPDGIFIYAKGGIVFANDSFVRMMKAGSVDDLIGLNVEQFMDAHDLGFIHQRISELKSEGDANPPAEERFLCRDGSAFEAEVASVAIRWQDQPAAQIIVHDITERKRSEEERRRLEEQLRLSQKLETIGTLAAGIAHDFNNLLVPVIGYTELTAADLPEGSTGTEHLAEVLKAAYRAKALVAQILSFSRQQDGEKRPLQLSSIVKEVLKMLQSTLPRAVSISREIEDKSSVVLADPTQMHQVLMNLCVNASQAMPHGGSLNVRLRDLSDIPAVCPGCGKLMDGQAVHLSVSDSGLGIDPSVRKRIFDPFFTTKPVGKGSGLGLAVTHGIITQHNGHICVVSEIGQGSTFHILLPAAASAAEDAVPSDLPAQPRDGSILLVDDDPDVLQAIALTLEDQGYRVTSCGSPDRAVEIFRNQPTAYDLILTDFRMPSMTGDKLAVELLRIRPEIPILVLSGFADSNALKNARGIGIRDVLSKPASTPDLASAIHKALASLQPGATVLPG